MAVQSKAESHKAATKSGRKRRASSLTADPIMENDKLEAKNKGTTASEAAHGPEKKGRRLQTPLEKTHSTLSRAFSWAGYHTKVKECGAPKITLETRLLREYTALDASKRIPKHKLREWGIMYAPQSIAIRFPVKNKAEPLPLALKEALDTFQDDDLKVRVKPPLKLQLALMQETNQNKWL